MQSVVPTGAPGRVRKAPCSTSELLQYRPLEEVDELESSWAAAFREVENVIANKTQDLASAALNTWIEENPQQTTRASQGILYGILTVPANGKSLWYHLTVISTDQYQYAISQLRHLINHAGQKLLVGPVLQSIWMTEQLIKEQAAGVDSLVLALLRLLPASAVTKPSCQIASELFSMLSNQKQWLTQPSHTELLGCAIYSALSLICAHAKYSLATPLQAEIQFCQNVLRANLKTCSTSIGRDFVRILYSALTLQRVTEMQEFWDQLVHPTTGYVDTILAKPTHPQFLRCRLPVNLETKLLFIFHRVPIRQLRRYQSWFQMKYLNAPEQLLILPDVVRYVCGAFHPTNEMIANVNLVPRWQMVGWWLKSVEGNRELQWQCEQAVLYDWATFNARRRSVPPDNLMNLEPGMLVMHQSLPKHPEVTAPLLHHLFLMMDHGLLPVPFVPQTASSPDAARPFTNAEVVEDVRAAMDLMVTKGVVRDLAHIYKCPRLDQRLRDIFADHFKKQIEFCNQAQAARQQRQGQQQIKLPSPVLPPHPHQNVLPPPVVLGEPFVPPPPVRYRQESDSESDTEGRHRLAAGGRSMTPSKRGRSPSPAEAESSDSDSDSEHLASTTSHPTLAALEPHLSALVSHVPLLAAWRESQKSAAATDNVDNAEVPGAADSPLKRVSKAIEGIISKYLRMEGHGIVADLSLCLMAQLAPELRSAASAVPALHLGDADMLATQAFDPQSLPFILLDTMWAYIAAADPSSIAIGARKDRTNTARRLVSHRLPKVQAETKLYQLLLAMENHDPSFSMRWMAVCVMNEETGRLPSAVAGAGGPAAWSCGLLQYYEEYCRHRMQVNAEKVQQSLVTPSLSSASSSTPSRLEMSAVIVSDLHHCVQQSKAMMLALLPAVLRHICAAGRRIGSPNAVFAMLLEQDWLWVDDLYELKVLVSSGVRIIWDIEGSALQLIETSLTWSVMAQKVLWDLLVHQAQYLAAQHPQSHSQPVPSDMSLRASLLPPDGPVEPVSLAPFILSVLDLKALQPQIHRAVLTGLLSFDMALFFRSKGPDPQVCHLCTRLLKLPVATFGMFPATMLCLIFGVRHQEAAVVSGILDVFADASQKMKAVDQAGTASPGLEEFRAIVSHAMQNLQNSYLCHEGGPRLMQALVGDRHRPLRTLVDGLKTRGAMSDPLYQWLVDVSSKERLASPREFTGYSSPRSDGEAKALRQRRKMKRPRKGGDDVPSEDMDDETSGEPPSGGGRYRRKTTKPMNEEVDRP